MRTRLEALTQLEHWEHPTAAGYLRRLTKARRTFEDTINVMAADIRERLVLPACKHYGHVIFLSGNGTYCFYDERYPTHDARHIIHDAEDARRLKLGKLARVFKVLDLEVDSRSNLGHWVAHVQKSDL